MYWLQRPPYLRWGAAVLLVLGALAWDLRRPAMEARPFASRDLAAGEAIDAAAVEWRPVPAHLLPEADLEGVFAAVDLAKGDPLLEGVLRSAISVPEGWLELPIEIGGHARAGDRVVLVVTDPPATVSGLVVDPQQQDSYSLGFRPAVVAVPAASAALVATAAAQDALVAAVEP